MRDQAIAERIGFVPIATIRMAPMTHDARIVIHPSSLPSGGARRLALYALNCLYLGRELSNHHEHATPPANQSLKLTV
jgi:hypothetical protein